MRDWNRHKALLEWALATADQIDALTADMIRDATLELTTPNTAQGE